MGYILTAKEVQPATPSELTTVLQIDSQSQQTFNGTSAVTVVAAIFQSVCPSQPVSQWPVCVCVWSESDVLSHQRVAATASDVVIVVCCSSTAKRPPTRRRNCCCCCCRSATLLLTLVTRRNLDVTPDIIIFQLKTKLSVVANRPCLNISEGILFTRLFMAPML